LFFAVFFALPLLGVNRFHLYVATLVPIYVILALGLNILVGYAGQLAFANAAMFGIGAYGAGLLIKHFAVPYWLAAPAGAVAAMAVGTCLALPALRLSGIYLALATLAFAQCTLWVMSHWISVTYGASGFTIAAVDFSPLPVSSDHGMYYVSWICCLALLLLARNLVASRIGRAFVALRDHEIAAQSLGVNLLKYKALAFALSGLLCRRRRRALCRPARLRRPGELRAPADGAAARRDRDGRNGEHARARCWADSSSYSSARSSRSSSSPSRSRSAVFSWCSSCSGLPASSISSGWCVPAGAKSFTARSRIR